MSLDQGLSPLRKVCQENETVLTLICGGGRRGPYASATSRSVGSRPYLDDTRPAASLVGPLVRWRARSLGPLEGPESQPRRGPPAANKGQASPSDLDRLLRREGGVPFLLQ